MSFAHHSHKRMVLTAEFIVINNHHTIYIYAIIFTVISWLQNHLFDWRGNIYKFDVQREEKKYNTTRVIFCIYMRSGVIIMMIVYIRIA